MSAEEKVIEVDAELETETDDRGETLDAMLDRIVADFKRLDTPIAEVINIEGEKSALSPEAVAWLSGRFSTFAEDLAEKFFPPDVKKNTETYLQVFFMIGRFLGGAHGSFSIKRMEGGLKVEREDGRILTVTHPPKGDTPRYIG